MKWQRQSVYGRLADRTNWHPWFAWHPVTLEIFPGQLKETVVWLEKVCRRRVYGRMAFWWEYTKYDSVSGLRNNDTQHRESI